MKLNGTAVDTFVSIVLPLRETGHEIEALLIEIDRVVRSLFRHYEIVLVDDASKDGTVETIERMQQKLQNLQLYCLNRRSGLDVAMLAGLDSSIGDFVFTMNLETDPIGLLPPLWEKVQQGNEVVCGVRTDRLKARGLGALRNRVFYRAFQTVTGVQVPEGLSDLRVYSRRVVSYITQSRDRHLLLKVLPFFTAFRVATVEYTPVKRMTGFGEKSLPNAILTAFTIVLASSIVPLRLLSVVSIVASSLSLMFAIYVLVVALIKRNVVEGWISLALPMAVMFFFISTILGILSEYIYILVQQGGNRPVYLIAKESTSSVLQIQEKLNVVESSGDFASR